MIDPTEHEIAAIEAASEPAGNYIEQWIGKTDMAAWTQDEWLGFLECVVTAYVDAMQRLATKKPNRALTSDDVPF
jgi:hypothetical protein